MNALAELLLGPREIVTLLDLTVGHEKLSNRKEGGDLVVRDCPRLELEASTGHLGIEEFVKESGLASPGLSDDRDHLAVSGAGTLERLAKRIHLFMAGDEPSESSARGRLKTPPR